MTIAKPVLRMFDYAKAAEFYLDWLGFHIDWEHREAGVPVYMQVSLGSLVLHLTEHHGDCTPGAKVFIDGYPRLTDFHAALSAKNYTYNRPGLEVPFYDPGALEMTLTDPFGNRLVFVERDVAGGK